MGEGSVVRDQDLRTSFTRPIGNAYPKKHVRLGLGIIEWRIETVRATHVVHPLEWFSS